MNRQHDYITIFSIGAGCKGQSTLRFYDVTLVEDQTDDDSLVFTYKSESSGEKHIAVFNKHQISGISYPANNQSVDKK